jgi:hypothetical protein
MPSDANSTARVASGSAWVALDPAPAPSTSTPRAASAANNTAERFIAFSPLVAGRAGS